MALSGLEGLRNILEENWVLKLSGKCNIALQVFRNFGPTASFMSDLNLKPEEGMLIKIQEDRPIEEIFKDLLRGS